MDANELSNLSDELMRYEAGSNLGMISDEMYTGEDVYMDENEDELEADDVIILHMDIREPLKKLQKLLEDKIGLDLKGYSFWLQDAQELEPHKNLVDQCVKGEGLVQINVQIQTIVKRINIVDVLKPTEAALAALGVQETADFSNTNGDAPKLFDQADSESETEAKIKHITHEHTNQKPCLNWVLDNKFKREQARLNIPDDPIEWDKTQVKYWFDWAVKQFNLNVVSYEKWKISGKELCELTHEQFHCKMPSDPGNLFWTHIQLLKECKFVSVVHKDFESKPEVDEKNVQDDVEMAPHREPQIMRTKNLTSASSTPENSPVHIASMNSYSMGTGSNGQVQLWQFLLELLTDHDHINIIQWVGGEGEFKLIDPECVARLWGEKKNKPAMNYEKLSRALRYYYDGDMISKVSGKRFAYKFDCDLKLLIGYSADELSTLVNESRNDQESDKSKKDVPTDNQDEELSAPSEDD